MDYVRLGRTGLKVSRICLGMMSYGDPEDLKWSLPEDAARPIIQRAVEYGINFFDTADVYSHGASEVITGKVLKELFSSRDEYVVATKVYNPMGPGPNQRSEEHTSELQSRENLVCRLLLEKKKRKPKQ